MLAGLLIAALGASNVLWIDAGSFAISAIIFALEPVFAGIFGFALAGDRLGVLGWTGCAVILCGIAVAEPAAAGTLARLVRCSSAPRT